MIMTETTQSLKHVSDEHSRKDCVAYDPSHHHPSNSLRTFPPMTLLVPATTRSFTVPMAVVMMVMMVVGMVVVNLRLR